jgi:hypothetical protein
MRTRVDAAAPAWDRGRAMPHKLLRRARTAWRVGPRGWALLGEAAAALLSARLRLRRLPFRQVAARLGPLVRPEAAEAPALDPAREAAARDIGWAVRLAAPALPFRALCLEQALAAQAMLARRGIGCVLNLGVEGAQGMTAHAWLSAGAVRVTGYPVAPTLSAVGCFVTPATAPPAAPTRARGAARR